MLKRLETYGYVDTARCKSKLLGIGLNKGDTRQRVAGSGVCQCRGIEINAENVPRRLRQQRRSVTFSARNIQDALISNKALHPAVTMDVFKGEDRIGRPRDETATIINECHGVCPHVLRNLRRMCT